MNQPDFFPPPPKAPPQQSKSDVPMWAGPPKDELGALLPVQRLLVQTDYLAISLSELIAYSTGFSFALELLLREPLTIGRTVLPNHGGAKVSEALKVAIEFEGAGRATSLDRFRAWTGPDPDPPFMQVMGYQYGSGQYRIRLGWWVWPIPNGDIRIDVEWPGEGIALISFDLDMDALRAAASGEIPRW